MNEPPQASLDDSQLDRSISRESSTSSYSSHEHSDFLIDYMEKFRVEGGYTDVSICVEGKLFPCHKVILAAGSPYFRSMFSSGMSESRKNTIELQQIDPSVFEYVLHFIYTGHVNITSAIMEDLYTQAHLFQITPLIELCVKFFQDNMSENNCLAALTLADIHSHRPLYNFAKEFACSHFEDLSRDDDFVKLSIDCVLDLLKDRRVNCKTENCIFDAAIKWLSYDIEGRKSHRLKVFECIKFPLLTTEHLMDVVAKCSLLQNNERGKEMFDDALIFHTLPTRWNMLPMYQITPRLNFSYFEAAILLGGRGADGLSNDVESYRPDTKEFMHLKTLPFRKRNEFAVCAVGNNIYVSGGLRSPEFWKYDTSLDTWIRGADMLHARRRHAIAASSDKIYVLGGFDEENVLSSIEMWSRQSNRWEEVSSLCIPVENMGYVSHNKKIYLFGGKNNEEIVTNVVQVFDTETQVCTTLKTGLPAQDMCLSAVVMDNQIYIVGLEGVFRYIPATEQWDILPDNNCARDFVSLAVLDEKVFAIGGRRRGCREGLYSDIIECYCPLKNTWEIKGSIPVPMYSYGCVRLFLNVREKVPEPPPTVPADVPVTVADL